MQYKKHENRIIMRFCTHFYASILLCYKARLTDFGGGFWGFFEKNAAFSAFSFVCACPSKVLVVAFSPPGKYNNYMKHRWGI